MNQGDYDLIDDILYPKSIWRYSDIYFDTYSKRMLFFYEFAWETSRSGNDNKGKYT